MLLKKVWFFVFCFIFLVFCGFFFFFGNLGSSKGRAELLCHVPWIWENREEPLPAGNPGKILGKSRVPPEPGALGMLGEAGIGGIPALQDSGMM